MLNKEAHQASAQLACEAAGSVRAITVLTREDDCVRAYSRSLDKCLQNSIRTAVWSNAIFAISSSFVFFVIAVVFWYGSILFSRQGVTMFGFFVVLKVSVFDMIPRYMKLISLSGLCFWCHSGGTSIQRRPRYVNRSWCSDGYHQTSGYCS